MEYKIENIDLKFNDDTDKILKYLKLMKPSSRKSKLSALLALTGIEPYKVQMRKDIEVVNKEYESQNKSKKQKENWTEPIEIK